MILNELQKDGSGIVVEGKLDGVCVGITGSGIDIASPILSPKGSSLGGLKN
jgi:hypothetical protein